MLLPAVRRKGASAQARERVREREDPNNPTKTETLRSNRKRLKKVEKKEMVAIGTGTRKNWHGFIMQPGR